MKKVLSIMLALAMVVLAVGCSVSVTTTSTTTETAAEAPAAAEVPADEDITLTLWTGYPEFDPWLADVIAAYTADHPNIKIEPTSFDLRDEEQKVSVALPAGEAADIIMQDPSWMLPFVQAGYLRQAPQNVVDVVDNEEIMQKVIADYAKVDGAVVGMPLFQSRAAIYYNKTMWEEAGLTEADAPKSYDDVVALSKKLAVYGDDGEPTRAGIALRIAGGGSGIGEKFWMFLMQEDGHALVKETEPGKWVADYDNDAGYHALKMYVDILWGDKSCSPNTGTDSTGFEAEQCAMFCREPWVIPDIAANAPDLNYGCFPFWNANLFQTNNWYVSTPESDAGKVAAAWDFILFMCEPENAVSQAAVTGWYPARKDVELPVDQTILNAFFDESLDLYMYPQLACNDEIQTKFAEKLAQTGFLSPEFYNNEEAIRNFLHECAEESNAILMENGCYGG